MKASDLIIRLQHLIKEYGDQEVFIDVSESLGLLPIGDVDIDLDYTGFIIWPPESDENHLVVCPACAKVYTAVGCHECPTCMHEWNEVMA
jgi:hypothetical protein